MSQQDKHSILSRESEVDIIRKVMLTMNEQKKYEVIKKLVDTNGNKDRAPAHTRPDDIRQQILLLYENKYFDTNIRHFTELLEKMTVSLSLRVLHALSSQQIMNSHIPKKSALIWIFCCLRATCSSLDSRFAKTNIKMGSFLQYIYMIKNGSSQVIDFYIILGTITCTVYEFLTIFRFAVPI